MGDENPIRTLGDYSKPSHEGYRNTIELPVGNNVVPLRSDTIRLVQNGCSFHGLRSEDPNQHLKDFLKLVDSLDLDGENRERTRLCLFQFSLRYQASNWLERLPAGSITTWEDLTTRFLAQFFPPGRIAKLRNYILIRTIDQSANAEESWALLEDLGLYENKSWNDPRNFAKPVKTIALPKDVPSTSDSHLIELENQVQRLMEAHLAPTQPTQVNKITTSCEICSSPHDTRYCMKDPEQAFVEYASSRTDKAGGKWYTFKPEQNNLGDTYNPSWKSHPNLRINEKLIEGLVDNNRFNDSLSGVRLGKTKGKTYNLSSRGPVYEAILKKKITKKEDNRGNFEIPCNIRGLKHVNALVDQGFDVNVMPYSTYMKLTDERPTKTDIKLSLASQSYIYPLGIAEDVLVEVAEHVYPVDFMILDIKEDKKRIPECLRKIGRGVKNDIEPITPTMTVNRLVLEWEERIKLHLKRKMEFDQWRSKNFKGKHPALVKVEGEMDDEGKVT
ncbi:MAK10-like protein [Tanacetum coccineum]